VERQLALAKERCRAEKAKREEAERVNAKIEERMKLHLVKQRAATQVAKRALKARSRAEVREGKAHEAVEELHAEREQLMDSLRAQEARVKELETFAALLREHNLEGRTIVDLLGKPGFGKYPHQVDRLLLELTASAMSAAHVQTAIRSFVKLAAPDAVEGRDVRIPSKTYIDNVRSALHPLARYLAVAAVDRAENNGGVTVVANDGTDVGNRSGGESYLGVIHHVQMQPGAEVLVLPVPAVMAASNSARDEVAVVINAFEVEAMGPGAPAMKTMMNRTAGASTDNAPNALLCARFLGDEKTARRNARRATAAAALAARDAVNSACAAISCALAVVSAGSVNAASLPRTVTLAATSASPSVLATPGASTAAASPVDIEEMIGIGCSGHKLALAGESGQNKKFSVLERANLLDNAQQIAAAFVRRRWRGRRERRPVEYAVLERERLQRMALALSLLLLSVLRLRGRRRDGSGQRVSLRASVRRSGSAWAPAWARPWAPELAPKHRWSGPPGCW
jgi:hypothetical protein